jgi:GNAT superfamily N-acetyltransferase
MSPFLQENFILHAGIIQVLRRGTAEVLEESPGGIFLRDTVSDTYMLTSRDAAEGIGWLKRHESRGYPLLALFQREITEFAGARYGLPMYLDCIQAVYDRPEPPKLQGSLSIRTASEADFQLVCDHYDLLDTGSIMENIRRGHVFIGEAGGAAVGFVGQHSEGSMGMLEILPEHRGRGYGTELEGWLIRWTLEQGLIPFCQVEYTNEKSLGLQKKLGLTLSHEHMYWLWSV